MSFYTKAAAAIICVVGICPAGIARAEWFEQADASRQFPQKHTELLQMADASSHASPDGVSKSDDSSAPSPGSRQKDGDAVYPNPISELAKKDGYKFEDGRYRNKDGNPQPVVTKGYMVDWGSWNGFRRYHDACHVCHGPNALGSTFAPSLADSLKTMDYETFLTTVSSGKRESRGGTEFVMPSFGEDKNIMCYIDDIYTYIKARSLDILPPGRPNGREDISPDAKKAADDCTG